jgi:hypothetical protein
MKNCAVIVDNILSKDELDKVVDRHMKFLPDWDVIPLRIEKIKTGHDYNNILTSEGFWKPLQDFEKILIFQHDSGILREGIEEFLEWDYVGAPWKANAGWARKDRAGGNGGFSLRCPEKALNLIRHRKYDASHGNEDVWYVHYLEEVGGNVAPYEVCRKFSVETEFCLNTFGYHAIESHHSDRQVQEILNQYGVKDL